MSTASHYVYWDPNFRVSLVDATIGTLDLTPANGYVVSGVDLGVPVPRRVAEQRVNGNGLVDRSRYHDDRAVSLQVTLDGNKAACAVLRDRLLAFMNPRLRPRLVLVEPRDDRERQIRLSAMSGGVPYSVPKFNKVALTWSAPDGVIENTVPSVYELQPTSGTEEGRLYDLVHDRIYPASGRLGIVQINNEGTTWVPWRAVIYGPIENPRLYLDDVVLDFNYDGGITLTAGQTIVIESQGERVTYDGDPLNSAAGKLDFVNSTWFEIPPGLSEMRLDGDSYGAATTAVVTFYEASL